MFMTSCRCTCPIAETSLTRSIPQRFSLSPLQITRGALEYLLTNWNVDLAFLAVIASFGAKPRVSEPGYDCFYSKEEDGSYGKFQSLSVILTTNPSCATALCYLHRFIERDSPESSYQFRQIGIYHSFTASTKSHVFILLQPHQDSTFDHRLRMAMRHPESAALLEKSPMLLHEILLGSYFDGWRWYLKQVAEDFQEDVCFPLNSSQLRSHG